MLFYFIGLLDRYSSLFIYDYLYQLNPNSISLTPEFHYISIKKNMILLLFYYVLLVTIKMCVFHFLFLIMTNTNSKN